MARSKSCLCSFSTCSRSRFRVLRGSRCFPGKRRLSGERPVRIWFCRQAHCRSISSARRSRKLSSRTAESCSCCSSPSIIPCSLRNKVRIKKKTTWTDPVTALMWTTHIWIPPGRRWVFAATLCSGSRQLPNACLEHSFPFDELYAVALIFRLTIRVFS